MSKVKQVVISSNEAGQRVDNFLIKYFHQVPKSRIYRMLRKGEVRINKKRVKQTNRLSVGDVVRIPPVTMVEKTAPTPSKWLFNILKNSVLYEDEGILILNKPSGVAVHGGSGEQCGIIEALRFLRGDKVYLELVHRLDKGTSGCLMIAKKRSSLVYLHQLLRDRQLKKTYHAIVAGVWPKACHKIDAALEKRHRRSGEHVVKAVKTGKAAATTFERLAVFKQVSLIAAHPQTGRTHQIRVHTQVIGHPILGDTKYQRPKDKLLAKTLKVKRLCLHAKSLKWQTEEGEIISIEAPYDASFNEILNALKTEN